MKELRVTYLKKVSLSMLVVMRERESVENVFFFFFFSTSFNMFFLKRDKKGGVYVRVMMRKNQRSVENSFVQFSVMTECVFIFTTCNVKAISALIVTNNIRKELVVMIVANYEYQIAANQSTKLIPINNIDSYHLKRYCF